MARDKLDHDPLSFLSPKDREVLRKLADLDGLSEQEEVRALIRVRVRALARLMSLYEGKENRLFEDQKGVPLTNLEIEPEEH